MISVSNAVCLLLLLLCLAPAYSADRAGNDGVHKRRLKILINNPAIGYSHMQFQGRIADVLTAAGHEVHVLIQLTHPHLANYTGVNLGQRVIRFDGPRNMLHDGTMDSWFQTQVEQCEELLANDELLAALEAEHYDVGISELYHVCAFGLFKRLNVPTSVSSVALGLNSMTAHFFGIPTIPSWMTSMFSPSMNGAHMNFRERFCNLWLELYDYFTVRSRQVALHQPLFDGAVGIGKYLPLDEVMRNVALVFVNVNEFFEMPRLISNKVIYVGGIVESKAGNLSDREKSILDGSKSGVVLFSFGTLAEPSQMRLEMKKGFIEAFKRFPTYDFIWKHDVLPNETYLFADAPNVHTLAWVNQKSLLQHPKLKAFITHCGMNSINEAAIAGVPVVATPLFGDQLYNAALVVVKGLGVHLDIRQTVKAKPIVEALEEVLHNPLHTDNARLLARKLARRPFSPEEKVVKWVGFAAEYPELNELNLPYAELNFFVYYSLDVLSASLAVVIIIGAVGYATLRGVTRLVFHSRGRGEKKLKAS